MKIEQVTSEYAKEHFTDPELFRVTICDDGTKGKHHLAGRIKQAKVMTLEDFEESLQNTKRYAFIKVSDYEII